MRIDEKAVEERVKELVKPIVERMGYRLFDVEFRPEKGWVLRIIVDKEGGITVGECEEISKRVSALLDVEDLIPFSYFLEVSSPGLTRELKKPEHFEFFTGRKVRIILREPVQGKRELVGVIKGVEEGIVKVEVEGQVVHIPFSVIARANLEM
ncbi:ribosome maturation factor RimP [Thermocrinis minervae]|uniref:Ribosome maturation factor RimP n=1 Tax=Thermocrinis minervae TaxID=381751 RepID=A0A1M6S551_9AQUI|nr:ribosome maturation factor RimP [Thermocrinis minervae]SHK39790.1 ribosome maturation factor RimP [Thermocrinis minervae]